MSELKKCDDTATILCDTVHIKGHCRGVTVLGKEHCGGVLAIVGTYGNCGAWQMTLCVTIDTLCVANHTVMELCVTIDTLCD